MGGPPGPAMGIQQAPPQTYQQGPPPALLPGPPAQANPPQVFQQAPAPAPAPVIPQGPVQDQPVKPAVPVVPDPNQQRYLADLKARGARYANYLIACCLSNVFLCCKL